MNYGNNFELFEHLTQDYWYWQIPLFLTLGFPMAFKGDMSNIENARSSHINMFENMSHVTVVTFIEFQKEMGSHMTALRHMYPQLDPNLEL